MREGGVFLFGEAENFEETGTRANRCGIFGIHFDEHLRVCQFTDNGHEFPRRYGDGSGFFDAGFNPAANADGKIGGGESEAVLVGFEQRIRKNRERRAGAHDVLDALQSFKEGFFGDCYLHLVFGMIRERERLCQRGSEKV